MPLKEGKNSGSNSIAHKAMRLVDPASTENQETHSKSMMR
jgi:hypothetical protein